MKEKLVTIETLAEITGLNSNALRTFLHGYRFTKFERNEKISKYRKTVYCFNKEFLQEMSEYLWLKRKIKIIKKLEDYYKKEVL